MNLPNQITSARFTMAIILFVLLSQIETRGNNVLYLLDIALALFAIAAITDFLDGYLARKYNMSTSFGRIADPFVDKILVGGTFIFLIKLTPIIRPWMVVIIIGREFLISGLRGYAESQGMAFPANIWGKGKTVFQCVTICIVLLYLGHFAEITWATWLVKGLVWTTVGITILSGYTYITQSRQLWQGDL